MEGRGICLGENSSRYVGKGRQRIGNGRLKVREDRQESAADRWHRAGQGGRVKIEVAAK